MVRVFFTVDTECSLGGAWENPGQKPVRPERAILGKIGSEYYGIPRIMDILEKYDLRGTFFVEVFAGLNGLQEELARACAQIVERGHDAELHLHPIHYYYRQREDGELDPAQLPAAKDMIGALVVQKQVELLQKGIALFRETVGKTPVAFRAGNFGASTTTLDALEEVGIRLDSSFNAAYVGTACTMDSGGAINRAWQHGTVWEVPITTYETGVWGLRSWKQLNINAVSLWEMKKVLGQAERIGLSAVTFIAHSFSLFKAADMQFERMRPDWLVLRRLEGLCRFLKEHTDRFEVTTFGEVEPSSLQGTESGFPRMGTLVPAVRKMVQAVNRLPWI
jgi:peptidoglycan/xylan/chitin deacetylase (PgdA/CDA1 family)